MTIVAFPASTGGGLQQAVESFLDGIPTATTRAAYAPTLVHLVDQAGAGTPVEQLSAEQYAAVMARWNGASAATWNKHLSALDSFTTWAQRQDLLALWRMLYETAARAQEILCMDVPDLDPAFRRARVTSKGGAIEYVSWATATARLLPRLLAGRATGPVFLAVNSLWVPRTVPRPLTRVFAPCGVPELGIGSLTSGDRWSDMIPACRYACCT